LQNPSSILIGITSEDMYPLSEDRQFCFDWRAGEMRSAVVSTARMNLQYEGEPIAVANVTAHSEKVVAQDIGILYDHKNASGNPRSVLFNGILGIAELDLVGGILAARTTSRSAPVQACCQSEDRRSPSATAHLGRGAGG